MCSFQLLGVDLEWDRTNRDVSKKGLAGNGGSRDLLDEKLEMSRKENLLLLQTCTPCITVHLSAEQAKHQRR